MTPPTTTDCKPDAPSVIRCTDLVKRAHADYMRAWRRTNQDSYNAIQAKRGRAGLGMMKCHECKLDYHKERAIEGRYIMRSLWLCPDCAEHMLIQTA